MSVPLPPAPDLQHLKKQAKDLLKAHRAGDPLALDELRRHRPRLARRDDAPGEITLHDAQLAVARRYGFAHWADLRSAVGRATADAAPARPRTPTLARLDDRMRLHVETLGFGTVGAYRIWCHRQGLPSGLVKSDAQLYEELRRRHQEPPRPALRRDYRPAEERKITQAYRGDVEGLWGGWSEPFALVEDEGERDALHRLLVHCARFAAVGGPQVWRLASHYRDWLRPVEEWVPASQGERGLLLELTGFLLGRDRLPPDDGPRADGAGSPSACHARARGRRPTVLSPADVEHLEERGWVRVSAAFPRETAGQIEGFMWSQLERLHGFRRDDPSTWRKEGWSPDRQPYHWTELHLNRSRHDPVYRGIAAERLVAAIEELVGERAASLTRSWGAFTPAFPSPDAAPWDLGLRWSCYPDPQGRWSLGVHTLFSQVQPRGGGRLLVEGSHRLVRAYLEGLPAHERVGRHRGLVDGFYQRHPYFAELVGKGPDRGDRVGRYVGRTTQVDGVDLRVVELTGEPGDAVLYDRAVVYAMSRNTTGRPVFARG